MSAAATYWTKEPQQAPLYSDWKISFTTSTSPSTSNSNSNSFAVNYSNKLDNNETGSVSTVSMTDTVDDTDSDTVDDDDGNDGNESTISSSPSLSSHEEEEEEEEQPRKQEVSFAVHRNMIGPRSGYFTKAFLLRTSSRDDDNNNNNNCSSSVITLPSTVSSKAFHLLVDAFEVLLDYCYNSGNSSIATTNGKMITTENAVALYCLCHYFDMDNEICSKVQTFISNDLNQHTVAIYYQNVKDLRHSSSSSSSSSSNSDKKNVAHSHDNDSGFLALNVNPIHEMVAFLCYQHPTVLSSSSSLLPPSSHLDTNDNDGSNGDGNNDDDFTKIADQDLWLSIGSLLAAGNNTNYDGSDTKNDKSMEKESKVWSRNITAFFDTTTTTNNGGGDTEDDDDDDADDSGKNDKGTNLLFERKETFRILTNSKVLPVISESAALRLLQHERWYGLADKQKEVDSDDGDNDDDADHDDDDSTAIELTFHPFSDDDDDDDSNLSSSLTTIKNGSGDEIDSIIQMVDNKRMLPQNNDDDTNKENEEQQYQLSSQHNTTSLQRRCIKALATSKWSGEENDVEMLFRGSGGGKLTEMTTPIVVEELLIESVIGERQLGTQLTALQAKVQIGNKLRIDENNKTHEQIRALQVDLLNEEQKRYRLAKVLEDEAMKREATERKLVTFDSKVDEEKKKLYSMNAMLEAKLDEEKKRSYSFDLRYRVLELSRRKAENDRQMLELTCTGIVKRLDVMSRQEEGWNNACGSSSAMMSPFILTLSTMSDRRECEKIKALLQQVMEDQLSQKNKYKSESKKSGTMIAMQAKKQ